MRLRWASVSGQSICTGPTEIGRILGAKGVGSGCIVALLPKKQAALGKDQLIDYREQGKRAYWIASTIEPSQQESGAEAPNEVLERLSQQFELCAYGLREVRREWERRDGDDELPRPFLIN